MLKAVENYSLNVINNASSAVDFGLMDNFMTIFYHLYSHPIFKNILDIVATKCSSGQLKFIVQDAKIFDIDAGNCVTMIDDQGVVNQRQRKYIITIKKLASDVIMHEIGHMLEHELRHLFNIGQFASSIMYEINSTPLYMQAVVKSLFVEQLKGYPPSQHTGELFARFFQFFAGANEFAFQSSIIAKYSLRDAISTFPRTLELLDSQLSTAWGDLINPKIAADSVKYSQNPAKQKFADIKVKSMQFGNTSGNRWGVKSNKDPQ
jgi:hypothetical protein